MEGEIKAMQLVIEKQQFEIRFIYRNYQGTEMKKNVLKNKLNAKQLECANSNIINRDLRQEVAKLKGSVKHLIGEVDTFIDENRRLTNQYESDLIGLQAIIDTQKVELETLRSLIIESMKG